MDPDPFDGAATAIATDASNAAATPAVATTAAEGLLLGGFNDTNGSGTIDAGPGWTSQLVSVPFYILVEDQLCAGHACAHGAVPQRRVFQGAHHAGTDGDHTSAAHAC